MDLVVVGEDSKDKVVVDTDYCNKGSGNYYQEETKDVEHVKPKVLLAWKVYNKDLLEIGMGIDLDKVKNIVGEDRIGMEVPQRERGREDM